MGERLGQVAPQLALANIELLTEEPGRSAGGAVAFEPADGLGRSVLLMGGEGHQKPAEDEGPLGILQRTLVVAEAVMRSVRMARTLGGIPGLATPAG